MTACVEWVVSSIEDVEAAPTALVRGGEWCCGVTGLADVGKSSSSYMFGSTCAGRDFFLSRLRSLD